MASPIINGSTLCRHCLQRLHHRLPAITRQFSSTPSNRTGALPTFVPTPSENLNALLTTFRTNILLPSALNHAQRQLVYRTTNHDLLNGPVPVTVKLGAETHTLRPLDHTRDELDTKKSFGKALDLMRESGDWRNVETWMIGLKMAKRKIGPEMLEKMVRVMNEEGQQGLVLQLVQNVRYTGLYLQDFAVVREVMLGAPLRIIHPRQNDTTVEVGAESQDCDPESKEQDPQSMSREKAVAHAEKVWENLWKKNDGLFTNRVEVLGVLLLVHALRGGTDSAALEGYARQAITAWEATKRPDVDEKDWPGANYALVTWAPVAKGLRMAADVLGKRSEGLDEMARQSEGWVQGWLSVVKGHAPPGKRRGVELCENLQDISLQN